MSDHVDRRRGVEVAPLSHRVGAMLAFRVAEVAVLALLAVTGDRPVGVVDLALAGCYLLATGLLSGFVLLPSTPVAVRAFGASLLVDGVFLQYAHERLGHGVAVDCALAAHLAAVCLLASFRTGLKLTVWQSMLLVVALRIEQSRLVPASTAFPGLNREHLLVSDMLLLWLVVLTTAVAASINERELRRRRYDAESLEQFATALLVDQRPVAVLDRLVGYLVEELGARRVLAVQHGDGELVALAGFGLAPAPSSGDRSAFLDAAIASDAAAGTAPGTAPGTAAGTAGGTARGTAGRTTGGTAGGTAAGTAAGPALALRLDPAHDPFLAGLLPGALRLAAIPLGTVHSGPDGHAGNAEGEQRRIWTVVEFGGRRFGTGRVERRSVSAAAQASATAALAHSRAELLERAQRAASTDGLTGLANRRTFDETMRTMIARRQADGQPFALVLADVDHFKSVNDRFGHQVGDDVLQAVARVFAAVAAPPHVPARYGGEEFALILPGAGALEAAQLAERLRLALHDIERPVLVSASFGVACVPDDADTVDAVILAADAALLHAKATGRDRVVLATTSAASGLLDSPAYPAAQAVPAAPAVPTPRDSQR